MSPEDGHPFAPSAYETIGDDAAHRLSEHPLYHQARHDVLNSGWQRTVNGRNELFYTLYLPQAEHVYGSAYQAGLKSLMLPASEEEGKPYASFVKREDGKITLTLPEFLFVKHIEPYMPRHENVSRLHHAPARLEEASCPSIKAEHEAPRGQLVQLLDARVKRDLFRIPAERWSECALHGGKGKLLTLRDVAHIQGYKFALADFLESTYPRSTYGDAVIEAFQNSEGVESIYHLKVPTNMFNDIQRDANAYQRSVGGGRS